VSDKARAQTKHAKRRAFERYGVELNRHQLRELADLIRTGKAEFVEKQSHRVSVFRVPIGDTTARVVYDRQRKTIVTFLPPERSEAATSR
jgi:hypothetical protein